MELLDQRMKKEMEECKRRAREAGLQFREDTLEYAVTNQDMLGLRSKFMVPTLYDHWMQDVEVLRSKWIYDALPNNPYETVINTRPPISFYNHDNPDWLNIMIFYHVLAHIDFDQNNVFFRRTWDDDFCGQALADKRLISRIRDEKGPEKRWVDYVIEFALNIENLVGYYPELDEASRRDSAETFGFTSEKADFYFGQFLRERYDAGDIKLKFYHDEVERHNRLLRERGAKSGEEAFFSDSRFMGRFPEFNEVFRKWKKDGHKPRPKDIFQYLQQNSGFLRKKENIWMKEVMEVIRRTSLYFQPQIRTKICNEGWASLWHERLFVSDERIRTHEVDYARVNAFVTSDPRVGLNVYAVGKHLFEFIEYMARRGKLSREYRLLKDIEARKRYDKNLGEEEAKRALFEARKYFDDRLLINFFSDEDFQDFVDRYELFTVGIRPSREDFAKADLYIKSRNGKDFRNLLNRVLYHPPQIEIDEEKAGEGELYLNHIYEGRTLLTKHVPAVLMGLEFFWGGRVQLETTEYEEMDAQPAWRRILEGTEPEYKKVRVLYVCEGKQVRRTVL